MTPVSHGKPCAGNPPARFDEGASASEEPRRKALLHTATITARVDSDKKRQAEEIFNDLGMTLSGAISVFINEVVQYQGIPFNIRRRPTANSRMEQIMDETDAYCRTHSERLSHTQVFDHAREVVNAGRRIHA